MHPLSDLSAYLDGELAPSERAAMEAHLAGCAACRRRLAELRSVASLVAALPAVRPARSLVPALAPRYVWARAVRSLSAIASGAFLFAFLVTAVARSGTGLGGGTPTQLIPAPQLAAPAARPAQTPSTGYATAAAVASPQPTPAPEKETATGQAQDRVRSGATAGPSGAGSEAQTLAQRQAARAPAPLTEPLLWLSLALIAALVAVGAHRRLRAR